MIRDQPYQIIINSSAQYKVIIWSNDNFNVSEEGVYAQKVLGLQVKDIENTFPTTNTGNWLVLFK